MEGKFLNPVYRTNGREVVLERCSQGIMPLCCEFAGRLLTVVNGRKLFCIGQLLDGNGIFENRDGYEFGWCGQNGMYARLFLERGLETGDDSLVETAISNLDAWSNEAVGKTGLIHTHYHWMLNGDSDVAITVAGERVELPDISMSGWWPGPRPLSGMRPGN